MFNHLGRGLLSLAAATLALGLAACEKMSVIVAEGDGVALSQLNMDGAAPTKLLLAGPDNVVVTEGAELAITVSGDRQAAEALRFSLKDSTLGIMQDDSWDGPGVATVAVTMPKAREIVLAGSGDIRAPAMVEDAEVNIAGSGSVVIDAIRSRSFQVNVMGTGTLTAAGTAQQLDFNVAGSGQLKARGLKVDRADINIAGSGGGEFASDGRVEARIAGSGDVTVYGRADCSVKAMGSGTVRCRPAEDAAVTPAAPPTTDIPPPPANRQPDA